MIVFANIFMMFAITIQLNQFPATLICLTTLFQILLFSVYLWFAATMIAAKPKRCDSFTDWVHLIPMGWMNASLFSNLFIFMFFSHRLFLISKATLFLLASFSSLYLYKLYIFCFSSLYSDEGLTSETSVSIRSFLRCRIYIFITKLFL